MEVQQLLERFTLAGTASGFGPLDWWSCPRACHVAGR